MLAQVSSQAHSEAVRASAESAPSTGAQVERQWAKASAEPPQDSSSSGGPGTGPDLTSLKSSVPHEIDMYVVRNKRTELFTLHPGVPEVESNQGRGWLAGAQKVASNKFILFESSKECGVPVDDMTSRFGPPASSLPFPWYSPEH